MSEPVRVSAVVAGFMFTVLLHTAIFFSISKALSRAGVVPDLSWGQSGVIAVGYVVSRVWMSFVTTRSDD